MELTNEINNLILSEAIEKLRNHYSGLMQGNNEKANLWFLNHDATHVIFGTPPFDIKGETFNDIWTIFGSTVTLKEYAEFFKFTTSEKVFDSYGGKVKVLLAVILLIPKCIRVFICTRKMTQKWPWNVTEELLQKKVGDIRKEFNIQLIDV
jgi:hypothetical protein